MNRRTLLVDDEPNVLQGCQRALRGKFDADTAGGGEQALARIDRDGPYAVIVSDMRMPGMNGVALLAEAKRRAPDMVRVMLTGNADQQTAIDAVNQGEIFRFLAKPCPREALIATLEAAVRQHQLITAERELLSSTLNGSVQVLTEVLSLVNPSAFGRTARLRVLAEEIATRLGVEPTWELRLVASLALIGCVILPPELLEKVSRAESLSDEERASYQQHPAVGADLLAKIPRLAEVAKAVRYQDKNFDGTGVPPDSVSGSKIPLPARILRVAFDLDRYQSLGVARRQALARMARAGHRYDPAILAALAVAVAAPVERKLQTIAIADLLDGMILGDDVVGTGGLLIATKGLRVSRAVRERLLTFHRGKRLGATVEVLESEAPAAALAGERVA